MPYADHLRGLFPALELEVADLFALEAHQIAELPTRAPDRELAEVLHAHPEVRTFLEVRHPPIVDHLTRVLAAHPPPEGADIVMTEQDLLWGIGDLLVYDTAPELLDARDVVQLLAALQEKRGEPMPQLVEWPARQPGSSQCLVVHAQHVCAHAAAGHHGW